MGDLQKASQPIVNGHKLSILVTDADKLGTNLSEMSDFFEGYIQQLAHELSIAPKNAILHDLPIADLTILNDVIRHGQIVLNDKITLIPDYDSLPPAVKKKLDEGIYRLGESRQVDGNLRAVVVDESGTRVKDVTLKKVSNDPDTLATTRSIATQMQLRQISAKLSDIQEIQSYQVDRDRDLAIITPFLTARDYILRAQNADSEEECIENLREAAKLLSNSIEAVYTDISTSAAHLARLTRFPIFQRVNQIQMYIRFLSQDIQLATMYAGLLSHVLDYLGQQKNSKLVIQRYQRVMNDFLTSSINRRGMSATDLIHEYYPYEPSNRNWWIDFSDELKPVLQKRSLIPEPKAVYIVSLEGDSNE